MRDREAPCHLLEDETRLELCERRAHAAADPAAKGQPTAGRRLGLELYTGPDSMPIRVAGDVIATGSDSHGTVRRETAAFELRSGGDEGIAILDVLTPET